MTDQTPSVAYEHMSTEDIIEIRDGLKNGRVRFELAIDIEMTPEIEHWLEEARVAMINAYDALLARRLS